MGILGFFVYISVYFLMWNFVYLVCLRYIVWYFFCICVDWYHFLGGPMHRQSLCGPGSKQKTHHLCVSLVCRRQERCGSMISHLKVHVGSSRKLDIATFNKTYETDPPKSSRSLHLQVGGGDLRMECPSCRATCLVVQEGRGERKKMICEPKRRLVTPINRIP